MSRLPDFASIDWQAPLTAAASGRDTSQTAGIFKVDLPWFIR
jgi:hypothetical protein